jgi:DNA polymerase-3 subunit gamma/tau
MYQVIARKYRPQNFDELIGQEHVRKTLSNAIESRRIAHGYIFSGQRGTGKTTVARILARCLNCIHGPIAKPCGVCSSCVEITTGNSVDVIEIDAASNRGINEMREIRENVRYRPARDRYKVFIVDEAHQITKEAFNALLKTLEEPPEWVVFILCTTEAAEIPITIASRCQHFNFRSVEFARIMERMAYIAKQEGISADDEVLSVIAQAGEGSVRDSLSALDQAIACCGSTLSVETVRGLLGMFGLQSLDAVSAAVRTQNGGQMLEIVQDLERNGQSLQHFSRELSRYWRNLLVAKISGKSTPLIAASEAEQQSLLATATDFSEEDLTRYLNLSLDLYKALQTSLQPRLHLELGLIKLVQAGKLLSIEDAIAALGGSTVTQRAAAPKPEPLKMATPVKIAPPAPAPKGVPSAAPDAVEAGPAEASAPSGDLRQDLHDALRRAKLDFSADAIQHASVEMHGSDVVIRASKMRLMSLKDPKLAEVAGKLLGKPVRIKVELDENVKAAAAVQSTQTSAQTSESSNSNSDIRERALSHPGVKRFQELFPGAQVRNVRNLNE